MNITKLQKRPKVFKRLFGISPQQFNNLLKDIEPLWREAELEKALSFKRKRKIGGGRKLQLLLTQMVAMLLLYYRMYIPHILLGQLFGIDDSRVSRYFKRIQPVVSGIFDLHHEVIEIEPEEVLRLCIDATEQEAEKRDGTGYSGKKKRQTIKTQIVTDEQGKIHHISPSVAGNIHDKKLFDACRLQLPKDIPLLGDLGYLGTPLSIPHKSSKLHKLTDLQREENHQQSKLRIIVEHVFAHLKKWSILKNRFRNTINQYSQIFVIVAGLYNLKFQN